MVTPNNTLQNVQTYQKAELGWLQNSFYALDATNKKFQNFQDEIAQLGTAVTFDAQPRYLAKAGLVIDQQPSVQRLYTLAVTQAYNISAGYTDQQFLYNVEDYMDRFGKSAVEEIGSNIEADVLLNFISGVVVLDPQNANFGQQQVHSGPFRFYGDGLTAINSYQQLAKGVSYFDEFGAAKFNRRGVIPQLSVPDIVGTGANQFAPRRNDDILRTWLLGNYAGVDCEWATSNLLPIHVSGTIGNQTAPNNVLTVVSTNDPTGANVTQIVCTEPLASTDANAIKAGDLVQFVDGVSGKPNMRFLTFTGHRVCGAPVQAKITADAATVAGTVTITIETIGGVGLVWADNANKNLNNAISAGMQLQVMPSHKAGCIDSGDQFYLGMPKLPDESPYQTSIMQDPDSGATIRHYWGSQFGQNNRAYVRDAIWGSFLVPENSMRILFPL